MSTLFAHSIPFGLLMGVFHSMDLSWNYAAESQAYDRVHRLGQEKNVFVKRLVVRNTIEERYKSSLS